MILESHIHLMNQALLRRWEFSLEHKGGKPSFRADGRLYHLIYPHIFPEEEEDNISLLTSAQRSAEVRALQRALSFGVCMSALCGLRFTDFGRVAFLCKQRFQLRQSD